MIEYLGNKQPKEGKLCLDSQLLERVGQYWAFLNIKSLYEKPTATIILVRWNFEEIVLELRIRWGRPLSLLILSIVLETLTAAIRQETEIKGMQVKN